MGVLCDIYDPTLWNYHNKFWNKDHFMIDHEELESIFNLLNVTQAKLSALNDDNASFKEIANTIEENIITSSDQLDLMSNNN